MITIHNDICTIDTDIKTMADARDFAWYIVNWLKVEFKRWKNFNKYVDAYGRPLLNQEHAELLNNAAKKCFEICELHGINFMDLVREQEQRLAGVFYGNDSLGDGGGFDGSDNNTAYFNYTNGFDNGGYYGDEDFYDSDY